MKELGQTFTAGPAYTKHTIMGKAFDANKPEDYLKSFAISKMG
jgi:nitrate/nitrite transport system substrate-binding protein